MMPSPTKVSPLISCSTAPRMEGPRAARCTWVRVKVRVRVRVRVWVRVRVRVRVRRVRVRVRVGT